MRKVFCHICIVLVALICFSENGYAFEFNAGTYYFDNSKQHFSTVKLLLGQGDTTIVICMSSCEDKEWTFAHLVNVVSNIDSYCFAECDIDDDNYDLSLEEFVALRLDLNGTRRTAISNSDLFLQPGWVYCPLYEIPQCSGYWRTTSSYDAAPSHTLPIVNINTENGASISNKENYINATLWLDNCGIEWYESLGTEQEPLIIEIKGRGNYTWRVPPKKPYKIKFEQKQSPLSLDKSKHFILKPDCDDWSGYLRNETGFEISRNMDMPYTTRQYPVEVILNGEYMGIYFLCEKIRVESGRVDIIEQQDYETNPENVTGGWLLELWYDEENSVIAQHQNNDPTNSFFAFTSESPEVLSQVQRDYMHDFIYRADSCIYVSDKNDTGWEQYFDINSFARFYVIHEVMENIEAFTGSLFMYKDWGEDEKLHFGPVWDFDVSVWANVTTGDHFLFDYDTYYDFLWIKELVKFPHFQQEIRVVWKEFMAKDVLSKIHEHAAQWRAKLVDAEQCDKQRWPIYASWHDETASAEFIEAISRKVAWLDEQWGTDPADVNCDGAVNAADVTAIYDYLLDGDQTFLNSLDVNGDGAINAADITAIYDILLGN